MAALVVHSRFAGLKIEDDDYPSTDSQKTKKTKTSAAKKPEPAKKNNKTNINNTKSQSANKKKKAKQNPLTSEQWETWKAKDEELVDGNFENELEQAILLSKLDYEEKKDVYKQLKKEAQTEKKLVEQASKSAGKKQKKKNVMSLEQFNDMVAGDEVKVNHAEERNTQEDVKSPDRNEDFFKSIVNDTTHELIKDRINDRVKNRQTDEVITRVQFADALEKKDKEIAGLRQEITDLKKELLTVKSRNKKLCNILGQGEMKDKAEVLVEVERLRAEQAELMQELATIHADLEKERSRNTDTRAKDKKKKGEKDK